MTKIIIDVQTGEIAERELNKAEKDQQKKDELIIADYEAAKAQQAAEKVALLARLGLTEDELKTILG
jgi:hypothetical protein